MTKALLIATVAAVVLGQVDDGVVSSTDLTPDVSASERDGQPRRVKPPRTAAPPPQESVPVAPPPEVREAQETTPAVKNAPSEQEPAAPRELSPEEARDHKAVAAFWFILPET